MSERGRAIDTHANKIRRPTAAVLGCAGPTLSRHEREFFRDTDPYGLVLFRRNCETPKQVLALSSSFRDAVGRDDAQVFVDQEGGRVQRLGPPHWPRFPAAARFGQLAQRDVKAAETAVRLNAHAIATVLRAVGIDVDALPVLDITFPGTTNAIGDRSFGSDPETVSRLGRSACQGLLDGGVLPIIKHLPGHGRAVVDSHTDLPIVDAPIDALTGVDFHPFQALADAPLGMTSHIVFTAIDSDHPVTHSRRVIDETIRGKIGFAGALLSDDLCMGALTGPPGQRAARALAAGCDLALHCNGDMAEMVDVAKRIGPLSDAALSRLAAAERARRSPVEADVRELCARVDGLLAAA